MERIAWNKGYTKLTHPSLKKIADTMSSKPKSNFRNWELANPVSYKIFKHSNIAAEFYGVLLGDGCIERFPRTEKLTLSFNFNEKEGIAKLTNFIEILFGKIPTIRVRSTSNCIDACFYQKHISSRLSFPTGLKNNHELRIPQWIKDDRSYLISCLKGMFESDGNYHISLKNHTYVIRYTSCNRSLLEDVFGALKKLDYNPQFRDNDVRLARKSEASGFADLIKYSKK